MANLVLVSGVDKIVAELRRRAARARTDNRASVVVGFTASYAVYVHENLTARHTVGQAKFLETPLRTIRDELVRLIRESVAKGSTLLQGLLVAGFRLQREAMKLTPVDTGALRASAFTRAER